METVEGIFIEIETMLLQRDHENEQICHCL